MARPNGIPTQNTGARKKMVQPVLPVLPLIPKTKKVPTEPKEQETTLNGSQAHGSVESETVQAESTPVVGGDNDGLRSDPIAMSLKHIDHSNDAEVSEQLHEADTSVMPAASKLDPSEGINDSHQRDEQAQQGPIKSDFQGIEDTPELVPATDSRDYQSGLDSASLSTPVFEVDMAQASTQHVNGDAVQDVKYDAGTAPEPVTGYVETQHLTHHSANPSLSNSSIQRTPQHAFAFPMSPNSMASPQNRGFVGSGHQSALSVSVNGYGSPAGNLDISDNGLMLTNGQRNFPTINDHIASFQFTHEWFDCDICVYFPQSSKPAFVRNAHSLILIRSSRMRDYIGPQRAASYPYYLVNLGPCRPIDPNAFDAALRFFYTDAILATERLVPMNGMLDKASRIRAFDFAMSYMISGIELDIEPVVTRSLESIGRLIDWDIAELVFKEAMQLRATLVSGNNTHAPPLIPIAAKSVLQHVYNLIVLGLNVRHFKIDTTAAPTDMTPRLAYFEGGRAVNPFLANMVFGSMPMSNTSPTSPATASASTVISPDSVASIIMLNCEFEDLREMVKGLKRVHGEDGGRVISEVVEERERRRLKILNDRSVSNQQRLANSAAWEVIGLHEYISDGALRRENVGFLPPLRRGSKN